jgi:phage terminase small subunit
MGKIQNPRYERFAQELASGKTADAAYEAAGYRKHRGNAARLSANEHIKERVREIQSIGAERAALTVQSLIDEAEQARIKAMDAPNGAAAAVSAITAKAKLAGLWQEKIDQHNTGSPVIDCIRYIIVDPKQRDDKASSAQTIHRELTERSDEAPKSTSNPSRHWSA